MLFSEELTVGDCILCILYKNRLCMRLIKSCTRFSRLLVQFRFVFIHFIFGLYLFSYRSFGKREKQHTSSSSSSQMLFPLNVFFSSTAGPLPALEAQSQLYSRSVLPLGPAIPAPPAPPKNAISSPVKYPGPPDAPTLPFPAKRLITAEAVSARICAIFGPRLW